MTIELVDDPAAFAGLREEWGALLERSGAAVFNSWEWLYPWHYRLGANRSPRVLVAKDAWGRAEGILPLCEERAVAFGRPVRRWAFLGEAQVGSDGLDVVAERGREQELSEAFADWLDRHRHEWDVLELTDLPADSPTLATLGARFRTSHQVSVRDRYLCPWTELRPGEPFDAFLSRSGRRENFLRRLKWLKGQTGFRVEVARTPSEVAVAMPELLRLHAMRWSGDGGSSGIRGPRVEGFHRDAAALMAERGKLRLHMMWLGETPVAAVYGLVHRGEFIYFQAGFDPAYRNRSVGMVLVGETFRDAISEGLRGYDFLRGTEPYKADWVSGVRRTRAILAVARSSAGARWRARSAASAAVRGSLKWMLPGRWVEWVRRWRRARSARA